MKWNNLQTLDDLEALDKLSETKPVLLFKHSIQCPVSSTALHRFEKAWDDDYSKEIEPVYLDLIRHREVSNQIAEKYNVRHASPQALLIKNGKAVWHDSHFGIDVKKVLKAK